MAGGQKTHRFTFFSWCSRALAFDMAARNRRWCFSNARGGEGGGGTVEQRADRDRGPAAISTIRPVFCLAVAWPHWPISGVNGLGTCPTADPRKLKWPLPRQAPSAVETPMYQRAKRGVVPLSKTQILRKSPNLCISLVKTLELGSSGPLNGHHLTALESSGPQNGHHLTALESSGPQNGHHWTSRESSGHHWNVPCWRTLAACPESWYT